MIAIKVVSSTAFRPFRSLSLESLDFTLFSLCDIGPGPTWPHRPCAALRLTGASDWSSETISVYLSLGDNDELVPDSVKDSLSSHISTLCTHTFLNAKPPRPTVSRWTGVAAVCRWCLKLGLFHQCLGPILQALTRKKDSDESTGRLSLDNDAGDSGFKI